jgi:hypothetical protein
VRPIIGRGKGERESEERSFLIYLTTAHARHKVTMDAQELERLSNELRRNYIEPPNWGSMRAMLNCLETLVEEFKSRYRLGNKASKAASSQADAHKIAQLREQIAFYDRKVSFVHPVFWCCYYLF